MNRLIVLIQTATLLGYLLLSGCGGEPYTYVPDNEFKPGPGLFSGEDGEFNLIGSTKGHETIEKEGDNQGKEQESE